MFESLEDSFAKWNTGTNERAKLQHTYVTLSFGLLLMAGIIGLMNRELGQNILVVAIISAGMFLTNAVAWALLQSAILSRVSRQTSRKKSK